MPSTVRMGDGGGLVTDEGLVELCALFAAALELDAVPPDTDFFLAGGHSLSALTLAVSIERAFGVAVRVRDIVDCATPALLAARLSSRPTGTKESPPPRTALPESVGLPGAAVGNATRWLWLERQRGQSARSAYTVPCLLRGQGDLALDRLEAAVEAVQRWHPTLRTVFVEHQGEPRAVAVDRTEPLHVVDLRGWEIGTAAFDRMVDDHIDVPFDSAVGPLFRITVFLRSDSTWWVLISADHLVCDGRALEILAADLVDAYRHPERTEPTVDAGGAPSGGTAPDRALAYWRRRLTPPPTPLPLPVKRPRHAPVGTTALVSIENNATVVGRLRKLAQDSHAGLFVPLAAAVVRTLAMLTGSEDMCMGTAVDRRSRWGLTSTVGFHVATVPLRLAVPRNITWRALIPEVVSQTMDAVDHADVSLDEIVAALNPPRSPWRPPFFDVWVALYPHIDTGAAEAGDIRLQGGPVPLRQGIFELSFQFVEHAVGLRLVLQYDTNRYDEGTARRVAQRVVENMAQLADDLDATGAAKAQPEPAVFGGFRFDVRPC